MQSKYLTAQIDWNERVRVMKDDLVNKHYDFLYFKICLNLNDARDNADYDKEQLLKKLLEARRKLSDSQMHRILGQLELMK